MRTVVPPRPKPGPEIHARTLRKVHGEGSGQVIALHGVDLVIPSGQFVCILGPSGSGKSTLLNLIGGLEEATSGSVTVGEAAVHELSMDDAAVWRRRNVGIIHQFFHLIPSLTLVQNVATALLLDGYRLEHLIPSVDALLERLGIRHRRDHSLDELAGGELQRVAIARALLAAPGLILADEPTGNLDTRTGADVLTLFREIVTERRTTAIMVTHDLQVTSYADRVLTIRDGRVVEDSMRAAIA